MDNIDMILHGCFLVCAMIGVLLIFHGVGLIYQWWRERWERKSESTKMGLSIRRVR